MNNELLNKIDYAYNLCDELDGLGYGIGHGYKQRDSQRVDFINVVMFFSNTKGEFSDKGLSMLKDCFGMDLPKETLDGLFKTMFTDNIIYQDGDYSTKVPATIQSYVTADNQIYASSNDDTKSYAGFVADVYYCIGKELLSDADNGAKDKFAAFMSLIAEYINDNLAYDFSLNFDL